MPRRPTLAERFAATKAVAPARRRARVRLDQAKREALAPRHPDEAIRRYQAIADRLAQRMAAAAARGASAAELRAMTRAIERSVRAAFKRIDAQSRREATRLLGVALPSRDARDDALRELFVDRNMALFRRLADDLAAGENATWRGRLIARDQANKLFGALNEDWALRGGDDEYIWVTSKDERVRPGHARLDGTVQRYSKPPNTGRREGENNPGQAVSCRCRGIPRSAYEAATL